MSIFFLVIMIWLALALACAWMAGKKGLPPFLWFGRGVAFGVFALLYLLLVPEE